MANHNYKKSILLSLTQFETFKTQYPDEQIGAEYYDTEDNVCILSLSGNSYVFNKQKFRWVKNENI